MKHRLKTISFVCSALFLSPLNAGALGQVTMTNPTMGSQTVIYEQIDGYAIAEGDIILGKIATLNRQGAVITPMLGGSRWPGGIVPYEIAEDLPFANKFSIYQAMEHWRKNSKIEFVELTTKNRPEYRDYVSFIRAEGTICASFVGRQGGKQIIDLSPRCTTMNTVHEIGHALGMWHEQSRADRDYYVRIAWENIEEDHKYNFNQHLTDGKDYGDYDYQSIMHYGPYAFSKNGKKTITPVVEGIEIGQRNHLSERDIAAINSMYPER
ncbi:Dot/Icm T4SS effector Zinc-dependent metalloprotease LegP [Legionella maioricensis]|uniref:Dot/Icm T4SS effector Zinc-dependent metalloprotease LegP n=1 Tax=Legionella maioricensis TaxID=2896528 RepID=UPI00253FBFA4|nr:Dot/Icm T4SS effector Zinc-dependent metalloprotease LegP [Legionella maioricensis]